MIKKLLILFFWFLIIGLFLYSPRIINRLFKDEKTLHVFAYPGVVIPSVVESFYKKTGVNVKATTFETNEELLAKLKISKGEGYDLLVAADYTTDLLINEGLVRPIDLSKISNFKNIDKRLLGWYFDKDNKFSVPILWTTFGIAYNKKFFGVLDSVDWDLIFKNPKKINKDYKVSMTDDARESIYLASLYLFNDTNLTVERLDKIKSLLLEQKKWVEIYSNERQDYFLLSGVIPIAFICSEFMPRIYNESDDFIFTIPKSGTLMTIENIMVTTSSNKADYAHQFLDHLLEAENALKIANGRGFFPVNTIIYNDIDEDILKMLRMLDGDSFKKAGLLREVLSRREIEDLWLTVKAS